ncbi:mannitol-1-phosphate 5-dehydrogenase [Paenactinomyces guangxiensis]|uniref:Mannitol-1-phosphate 5-dehydrogenase n=1 Tax=Paenactinomyces guangxiensis TaxID=1490290 RepID=A0A7W2A665_9BACL|nr:mannitol-1-phosphate 5-dehydrogenase [Paenactinomyces guangxiensis]MBA4493051.1 mannitol-1-phosphate 5-dehydrogenase [Paenactinomyces guangxiensis]MBH8590100.1 mannitol-1-phosphate 5-dehydrogenase [Paenactinomyces guangxiensis]
MKALHFGAGKIGKGLIGNLLNKTGYEVCFVDVNQEMIDCINKRNSYSVELLDEEHSVEIISPVSALNSITQKEKVIEAIVNVDIITTSVGVVNLPNIARVLAEGLLDRIAQNRKKIDVIANENAINASLTLKKEIEQIISVEEMTQINSHVGFPNSAIDRLALSKKGDQGEIALVEPFFEWVINKSEMVNFDLPLISNAIYVENLKPYIERKLYIVNMGHAATAYLGFLTGESTIAKALRNPEVERIVRAAMVESSQYMIETYRSDSQEMIEFIEKTLKRFKNSNISDEILRVGRSPIRKLGYEERLVKPARELFKLGLPFENLAASIAAGYLFNNPEDEESFALQSYIRENGIDKAISHFSQIEHAKMKEMITKHYDKMKNNHKMTH